MNCVLKMLGAWILSIMVLGYTEATKVTFDKNCMSSSISDSDKELENQNDLPLQNENSENLEGRSASSSDYCQ